MAVVSHRGKKRKGVHFFSKSHPPGLPDRWYTESLGVKSILYENFYGETASNYRRFRRKILKMSPTEVNNYINYRVVRGGDRALLENTIRSLREGKDVHAGELVFDLGGWLRLQRLLMINEKLPKIFTTTVESPNLQNIKQYYVENGKKNRIRHVLIKKNIVRQMKKGRLPLVAEYGTAHSLLSHELRSKGISSSRESNRIIFDFDEELIRRLIRGSKPGQISPFIYKRAFANRILRFLLEDDFGVPSQLCGVCSRALLDGLNEEQINNSLVAMRTNVHSLFPFVLALNNRADISSPPELLAFVGKKRPTYKPFLMRKK
jgi:hypothetical protein